MQKRRLEARTVASQTISACSDCISASRKKAWTRRKASLRQRVLMYDSSGKVVVIVEKRMFEY